MKRVCVCKVNGLRGSARNGVCYVGRAHAGWPHHKLSNPFVLSKNATEAERGACLRRYRKHLANLLEAAPSLLDRLWEDCEQGAKPLGCWCVNAEDGDGQPVVCHAQVLAMLLTAKFVRGESV